MKSLTLLLLSVLLPVHAATIAVIDSGVDVQHKDFGQKIWTNPNEVPDNGRDEDANGYQDDVYGWNFAENNNLVIDRSYIGTFSKAPYKFFDIQGRNFLGQATEEEIRWVNEQRSNPEFIKEMSKFGNFVHGTHVAGITVSQTQDSEILSIKLIPTEVKPFAQAANNQASQMAWLRLADKDFRMQLLKGALDKLAEQQMERMEEIGDYISKHNAHIANGSFGTGYKQAKIITNALFTIFFFRKPTAQESDEVAKHFLNSLVIKGQEFVGAAKNTLFVFAAGNDATDNDVYPTSPTNVKADNVISVAATYEYKYIAPFSNYGVKMVDVAAPGMLIHSQIPGDEYLKISGTSQAAPYVAGICAKVLEINENLKPADIKKIILGTTDIKAFLKDKVKTQGIVNSKRAEVAANLSLNLSVDEAIELSLTQVEDIDSDLKDFDLNLDLNAISPIQMPSMFQM